MSRAAPSPLSAALANLARGLAPASTLARVQEVWEQVAGPAVAAAATPMGERDGIVTVGCEAAVWAQELSLMAPSRDPAPQRRARRQAHHASCAAAACDPLRRAANHRLRLRCADTQSAVIGGRVWMPDTRPLRAPGTADPPGGSRGETPRQGDRRPRDGASGTGAGGLAHAPASRGAPIHAFSAILQGFRRVLMRAAATPRAILTGESNPPRAVVLAPRNPGRCHVIGGSLAAPGNSPEEGTGKGGVNDPSMAALRQL